MRYFITFACYGAHLHGDESGSVDQYHNLFGSRLVKPDPQFVSVLQRLGIEEDQFATSTGTMRGLELRS